jgi:hypothetical protein
MECGGRTTKEWRHRFVLRNRSPIQSGVVIEDSRAPALQKDAIVMVSAFRKAAALHKANCIFSFTFLQI